MGITVSLDGIKGLQDALDRLENNIKIDVADEINASALKIQSDAKKMAPVNFGTLRNQIALTKESSLTYSIEAKASYSAYIEFGTGGKVSIPAGYQDYAATFRGGNSGKFKDFILALTLWVERKGIANGKNSKKVAYAIALSILKKGLRPQPFLIPAFEQEKPKLINRLKQLINA